MTQKQISRRPRSRKKRPAMPGKLEPPNVRSRLHLRTGARQKKAKEAATADAAKRQERDSAAKAKEAAAAKEAAKRQGARDK